VTSPGPAAVGPAGPRAALYSDLVRERWRRPRFRGDLPAATLVAEDVNPLCGDRVRFQVRLEDGRIADARFAGDSCAICTASADVVAELATGRSTAEARALEVADVLEVLDASIRPARMSCVTLPVTVLRRALDAAGAPDDAGGPGTAR
jgi:nitrogen fixation NifU-like protein